MKTEQTEKIYQAALYLRLSDEKLNAAGGQSDSIVNQEAFLRAFAEGRPDIRIYKVYRDDGWSGVNFDRPGFQEMMQAVYDGKADCIIVKDLSRLGRNHTETGKYISRIFPALGVRFIAVNDSIDTLKANEDFDNIIIPFKDLLNDSYSRDLSVKIRSANQVLRKQGRYFGRGLYGYRLDPEHKGKLIIDEEAAAIVRQVFRWTIDGMGPSAIARKLNELKVPSPAEYKRLKAEGKPAVSETPGWYPVAIYRMLRNEMYTGVLEQGKYTTPNHKVKKKVPRPSDEVYRFENAFEPIISKSQFQLVQRLTEMDVLTAPGEDYVRPLCGFVTCGECGGSMIRFTTHSKGKKYLYYICSDHRFDSSICSYNAINADRLEEMVLEAVNVQLAMLLEVDEYLKTAEEIPFQEETIERYQLMIAKVVEQKKRGRRRIEECRKDYEDGILSEEEFRSLKSEYEKTVREAEHAAARLEEEKNAALSGKLIDTHWAEEFRRKGRLDRLSRLAVVALIDRVTVHDKNHITIRFRFEDEVKMIYRKMHPELMEG